MVGTRHDVHFTLEQGKSGLLFLLRFDFTKRFTWVSSYYLSNLRFVKHITTMQNVILHQSL